MTIHSWQFRSPELLSIHVARPHRWVLKRRTGGGALILHGEHHRLGAIREGVLSCPYTCRNHLGAARKVAVVQADMKIQRMRSGKAFLQPLADGSSRLPVQQLAEQKAKRSGVVAVELARSPPGLVVCQRRTEPIPIVDQLTLDRLVQANQASPMTEHVSQRDSFFAIAGELRPGGSERLVQLEQTFGHCLQHADCRDTLGRREKTAERVFAPELGFLSIRVPGPDIHNQFAVDHDSESRAYISALRKPREEYFRDFLESRIDISLEFKLNSVFLTGAGSGRSIAVNVQ